MLQGSRGGCQAFLRGGLLLVRVLQGFVERGFVFRLTLLIYLVHLIFRLWAVPFLIVPLFM